MLPTEATAYWARPITTYSLSPDPGLFAAARGYKGLVAIFDEALPEESRDAVSHLRPLDAVAVLFNHYFSHYGERPPQPLVCWVYRKLGISSLPTGFDEHVETTAEGPGAAAELDEALRKTAREFDRKNGFWGYGVAREEIEPGRFRQTVVFSEKRLLLEDFPKFYEPGGTLRLKGRVPGPDRGLRLELSSPSDKVEKDIDIDAEGSFTVELPLPKTGGVPQIAIERSRSQDADGRSLFFARIYVGVSEPASPDEDLFFQPGVPRQNECVHFEPQPPPDNEDALPKGLTYEHIDPALDSVAEEIKACNGDEGGQITMTIVVDRSGQVRSAGAFGGVNGTPLDLCISRALCNAKFGSYGGPQVTLAVEVEL